MIDFSKYFAYLDAKGEKSFQRFLAMVADYIQSIGDLEKSYEQI